MAKSELRTGTSLDERLMSVTALLLDTPDLDAMRYAWSRIIHRLQGCLERAKVHRLRTGRAPQLAGLDWLSRTVQDHPAFERLSVDAKSMQAELQGLIARIGRGA
jgi:hypothetical protein